MAAYTPRVVYAGLNAVHLPGAEAPRMVYMIRLPNAVAAEEALKGTRLVSNPSEGRLHPEAAVLAVLAIAALTARK